MTHTPKDLRYTFVQLVTYKECSKSLPKTELESWHICTKNTYDYGQCTGDSGGLILIHGELVGLVSIVSNSGCLKGYPDVIVHVDRFRNWITDVVNGKVKP